MSIIASMFICNKYLADHLLFERGGGAATVAGYSLDLELFSGYLETDLHPHNN